MRYLIASLVSGLALFASANGYGSDQLPPLDGLVGINSNADLDAQAAFCFAIMSDSKGDDGTDTPECRRMERWIKEANCAFVVGLGDNLKKGRNNPFLKLLRTDPWWHDHFYPIVGDGENEFYGSSQYSFGAGGEFFKEVDLADRPGVQMRQNGLEYYARIPVEGYTVHLIMMHFPDYPKDNDLAFLEDSREWLIETLHSIEKGPRDIVVAAAHTIEGFWITLLNEDRMRVVAKKVDLALSATTHCFRRNVIPGYADRGPLAINTGAISHNDAYSPPGYVQVHVLAEPTRLVVQYLHAGRDERELRHSQYAFLKEIDGEVRPIAFVEPSEDEAEFLPVARFRKPYSKWDMSQLVGRGLAESFDADVGIAKAKRGLPMGTIGRGDLSNSIDIKNEIWVFPTKPADLVEVYGPDVPYVSPERLRYTVPYDQKVLRVAATKDDAQLAIDAGVIGKDQVQRTGRQVGDVMVKWLEKSSLAISGAKRR